MKEYILNDSPVKTSVNYGINNIKLNLEIPEYKQFDNFSLYTEELDKIDVEIVETEINHFNNLKSKIGLEFNNYQKICIKIPKNTVIKNAIVLDYLFDEDNDYLVDNIEITLEENSEAKFILHYCDILENNYFHHLKQTTLLKENSKADITVANLLNNKSDSFIAIENDVEKNAQLTHNLIELGGKNKISNYYSTLSGDYSKNILKNIYLGTNNDLIDINYNIEILGKNAKCNIESQGAITDLSKKNFKGTIDFKKGSCKSEGTENENCMILSNKAKSKSLPMLLCHEEDVNGEHGVSSGKLDESKLFYIMTKGISYNDAKKLIVKANFDEIIKSISNSELQNEINTYIDQYI